jgi:hypothetical protein
MNTACPSAGDRRYSVTLILKCFAFSCAMARKGRDKAVCVKHTAYHGRNAAAVNLPAGKVKTLTFGVQRGFWHHRSG